MSGAAEIRVYPARLQALLQYVRNGSKKCLCGISAGSEIHVGSIDDKGVYAPILGVSAPLLGATSPILGTETVITSLLNMQQIVHSQTQHEYNLVKPYVYPPPTPTDPARQKPVLQMQCLKHVHGTTS